MSGRVENGNATMWLRARTRAVAIVALLAMALQLVCTFGHVHALNPSGISAVVQSKAAANASIAQAPLPADSGTTVTSPSELPSGADGDALCPLCLVGNLVASAIAPSLPLLALPISYARAEQSPSAIKLVSADIPTSFWSRGPPTT